MNFDEHNHNNTHERGRKVVISDEGKISTRYYVFIFELRVIFAVFFYSFDEIIITFGFDKGVVARGGQL
jgi:hypothetical protein